MNFTPWPTTNVASHLALSLERLEATRWAGP